MGLGLALEDSLQELIRGGKLSEEVTAELDAVGEILTLPLTDGNYRFVWVTGNGTVSGLVLTYEVFDGTSWIGTLANSGVSGTIFPNGVSMSVSTSVFSHFIPLPPGATQVRARVTSLSSGSSSVRMIASTSDPLLTAVALIPNGVQVTSTQGGSAYSLVSTASTNLAVVRNTAANLFELCVSNPTASAAYVKLYNKTTTPAPASDVPVITIPAPASSFTSLNLGSLGKRFASGIGIAITGAAGATDTTSAPAGVQVSGTYI